ncbi:MULTISPECIES: hypothetical protein [Paraliobacillus]|uniref:HAAS domain-containing protein n=1 Tax=Paraliobacillus TaxID=200903 RepID=UPI000DD48170|nr:MULTISPECIES: hypothetical protein [Paraliobacillus]
MDVSKSSRDFLDDLRLYLFSSGKKENEIDEIVGELEDHLHEAETNGKNVEDIIGKTPSAYMKQIAKEMPFDLKGWLKYLPILVVAIYAYDILGYAFEGDVEYSLLRLVGNFLVMVLFIVLIAITFKYVASTKSKIKEYGAFAFLGFFPLSLFIGLIYLDRFIETPAIQFGITAKIVMIAVSVLVLVGVSIWSKTWISIIIPIIMYLPDYLLSKSSLSDDAQLLWGAWSIPIFFGIYLLITIKIEKRKAKI